MTDQIFAAARQFLEIRGWQFIQGSDNPECKAHSTTHRLGFLHVSVGIYNGFDVEQEVIDWVSRLIPNAI